MKDNGKTGAVKNCTTCRHRGNTDLCIHCRNGNPPADAAAYDLLWEDDAREFTPGEVVMWADSECTVLSVCESDGAKMLELLKIDVDKGNSGEFLLYRSLVAAAHCAKRVKELTAREYAEKLRTYFGKPETGELDIQVGFCEGRNCTGCAFNTDTNCVAMAGIMFDPARALQMIQEAENRDKRDKPKGKTYLEDFREKMPNAYIDPNFGTPAACRKRMYYHEIDDLKCGRKNECSKCWNEEMPEVSDNAEG